MRLPIRVGGGPDETEKAYRVLRSAEGIGGSAADDSGIDGLWRRSIALGLSCATSAVRRANANASPLQATDMLPYYERVTGELPAFGASHGARIDAVVAAWAFRASAVFKDIERELRKISADLSLRFTPDATSTTSLEGRWFGPIEPELELPHFDGVSELGGETTYYLITVFYDVSDPGNLTAEDLTVIARAERLMRRALPPWWGVVVSVTDDGFTLDESPLGLTGLDEDE